MSAAPASAVAASQASLVLPAFSNGATTPSSRRSSTDSTSFFDAPSAPVKSSIGVKKASTSLPAASSSGMKLGNNAKSQSKAQTNGSVADAVAGEWEDDGDAANAWGTDDLIDVNADEDDWAAFESAPVAEVAAAPPQSYYVTSPPTTETKTSPVKQLPQPSPPKGAPKSTPRVVTPAVRAATPVVRAVPLTAAATQAGTDGWGTIDDVPEKSVTPEPPASSQPSLAGMSKEEKDKEMARRREERKAVSRLLLTLTRTDTDVVAANSSDEGSEESKVLRPRGSNYS